MIGYLAQRLLRALLTIFLVVTFAFFVLRLSGDPALLIMSVDAPPESVEAFRKSWGLDRSIWVQYFSYFGHALTGDLAIPCAMAARHSTSCSNACRRRWPSPSRPSC